MTMFCNKNLLDLTNKVCLNSEGRYPYQLPATLSDNESLLSSEKKMALMILIHNIKISFAVKQICYAHMTFS